MKHLKPRVAQAFARAAAAVLKAGEHYRWAFEVDHPGQVEDVEEMQGEACRDYFHQATRLLGVMEGAGVVTVRYDGHLYVSIRAAARAGGPTLDFDLDDLLLVVPLRRVGRIGGEA